MKKIISSLLIALSTISYCMEEPSWRPFEQSILASDSSEHELREDFFGEYSITDFMLSNPRVAIKSESAVEEPTVFPTSVIAPLLVSMEMLKQESSNDAHDGSYNPKAHLNGKIKKITNSRLPGKHKCHTCKKNLRYSWGLTSHIKRLHENPIRWGCYFAAIKACKTTFLSNSDYNRHLKVKHHLSIQDVRKINTGCYKHQKKQSPLLDDAPFNYSGTQMVAHRPVTRTLTGSLKPTALTQ